MKNKQFDVSVIGELNIDIILNHNDSFPEMGKEILAKQMNVTMGSSSAIFASNLSSLGASVAFIGKLGSDIFGDMVMQTLNGSKVDTSAIKQQDELCTGATIVLNFGEDRAMVTHPGAMEHLTIEDINWDIIKRSSHLHFSSFFIQKGIQKDIAAIFKEAKKHGLTTSFDMQWDPAEKWNIDLAAILPHVNIFLPNETELLQITNCSSVEKAIAQIAGFANVVVVKQGNKGSTSFWKGKTFFQPAFLNNNVVDAIGAGDSFNAGFIYKFIQHQPIEVCQEFGNVVGAISTTAAGGTTAFKDKENILKTAKEKFGYAGK
ncbi:MAG: carbohydrate kinase family protein [Chitinophagaceae bacterium]|nr:carbohydrate kinase family protein [Chitinophagaceae bacterium]